MQLLSTWVPRWVIGLAIMAVAAIAVLIVYRWFLGLLIRLASRYSAFLERLVRQGQGPASAILVIFALGATLPAAALPDGWTRAVGHLLLIALVLAIGWAAGKALDLTAELYLRRFRIDVDDNLLARKHVTQVNILLRAAQTLLVIVTVSAALMTIEQVRQYGVSLFASAGAAGLVVGLAARPVLGNLLAGIQIAVTQPIRVEDSVVVEGEWGWIETITSTYVVVRIWDLRRMIVPLSHFIEKPFENWTYHTAGLIGSVYLYVDYTAPIASVRAKLEEIVRASPLWDGKVVTLQVTDASAGAMQLRALVSARNAGDTFTLRCLVREELIAFLQSKHAYALPRQRSEVAATRDGAGEARLARAVAAAEAPPRS